eukprot:PITA_03528
MKNISLHSSTSSEHLPLTSFPKNIPSNSVYKTNASAQFLPCANFQSIKLGLVPNDAKYLSKKNKRKLKQGSKITIKWISIIRGIVSVHREDFPTPQEDASTGEVVYAIIYRQLVRSLMYLMNRRPDICYAVNKSIQFMVNPTKLHWKVAKHVLRYLRCTTNFRLWYKRIDGVKLQGFTDAYCLWSPSNNKRTSRAIFSVESIDISWYSRKWRSIALSSMEAEYMDASQATCEAIWMSKILVGIFNQGMDPTMIYCDNQICIKLSENPAFYGRCKNIDIKYYHLRDCVQRRIMTFQHIPT